MIDIPSCFKRIGYSGATRPTLATLKTLQLAFLLKVPFENLDIHFGRRIKLSSQNLYKKIVSNNRGGFCYECNILFSDLLKALGFRVDYLSARMATENDTGPEFDHMALRVRLDHDYLVDVGNGQSCREPLRIDGTNSASSEGYVYRAGSYNRGLALFYRQADEEWMPRFIFTLKPRQRSEFSDRCDYHQTSPDSIFTRQRLVTMAAPEGRISLIDMQLVITNRAEKHESVIYSEDQYDQILKHNFGIEITDHPLRQAKKTVQQGSV
ncbi:MAG: arylamine N-acetyltransferase [Deltaproteobacteria bacterium]|jgi:N-hydroxyarylamine O-acetyltransferase|nr:arylamine N-acetyltransferase [Deltaproteobacteria bacterium]